MDKNQQWFQERNIASKKLIQVYLKKILWAVAILGLLICGFVVYQIYSAIFSPNTPVQ